jgi:hypothetical protein
MGIIDLIKGFLEFIKKTVLNAFTSINDSITAFKIHKKTTNKFDIEVDVLGTNRISETYLGKITPQKNLVYIPTLRRPVFNPTLFSRSGKEYVIASEKQCDNNMHPMIIKMDAALKNDINIRWKMTPMMAKEFNKTLSKKYVDKLLEEWKYDDVWVTVSVENVGGSLDFTLFDNEYAISFATMSELVMNSELMKFLIRQADSTLLMVAVLAGFAGMSFGLILGGILL